MKLSEQLELLIGIISLSHPDANEAWWKLPGKVAKLEAELAEIDDAHNVTKLCLHESEAENEALRGAVKTHALRFNSAAMARCYYCIFCNAELGMGAIEHKEGCVALLTGDKP